MTASQPANTMKHQTIKRLVKAALLVVSLAGVSACEESKVAVSITGYNHSKVHPITIYAVNGSPGSNLFQESGGGGDRCCINLPKRWTPGLKATVSWMYGRGIDDPEPPPPQEAVVDIPEYKQPAKVQVHFYDNHRVKIVVSSCNAEHPFYPMSDEDRLPWKAFMSKEEAIESNKSGGMEIEC